MSLTLGSLKVEHHFFEQRAQQFFTIPVGGGDGAPNGTDIGAEQLNALELFLIECAGLLLLASAQFRFGGC